MFGHFSTLFMKGLNHSPATGFRLGGSEMYYFPGWSSEFVMGKRYSKTLKWSNTHLESIKRVRTLCCQISMFFYENSDF